MIDKSQRHQSTIHMWAQNKFTANPMVDTMLPGVYRNVLTLIKT